MSVASLVNLIPDVESPARVRACVCAFRMITSPPKACRHMEKMMRLGLPRTSLCHAEHFPNMVFKGVPALRDHFLNESQAPWEAASVVILRRSQISSESRQMAASCWQQYPANALRVSLLELQH